MLSSCMQLIDASSNLLLFTMSLLAAAGTVVCMALVDRFGRRPLLVAGSAAGAVIMVGIALVLRLHVGVTGLSLPWAWTLSALLSLAFVSRHVFLKSRQRDRGSIYMSCHMMTNSLEDQHS